MKKDKHHDTRAISRTMFELVTTTLVLMILFSLFAVYCVHRAHKEGIDAGIMIEGPNGAIYPNPNYKPKPEDNTVDPE